MPDLLERLRAALEGRYAVELEVGRGGMATFFLAEDLKHQRRVAIKQRILAVFDHQKGISDSSGIDIVDILPG